MTGPDPAALEREFDALTRGIDVPPEWRAGAIAGYAELRAMTELLRGPREPESEPATIFSPRAILPPRDR
ncbi:MAG: DUF4089 domain-containing protein [Actinomycetota bacterium]|nr:DUF4089 domain-containing protein [Actinomycetota bacterium]